MTRGEAIERRVASWSAPVVMKLIEWRYVDEWPLEITRDGWRYLKSLRGDKPKLQDFVYGR